MKLTPTTTTTTKRPIKTHGYSNRRLHAYRDRLADEAMERSLIRAGRTTKEQIQILLTKRPGQAKKELNRLYGKLALTSTKVEPIVAAPVAIKPEVKETKSKAKAKKAKIKVAKRTTTKK